MITTEPPPGSVITWCVRFNPGGQAYQYTAFRVQSRGWFTSSTKLDRALMWSEVQQLIGDTPAYVATAWAPLRHTDLPEIQPAPTGAGDPNFGNCNHPSVDCLICQHTACGWCPDCSPGVPEWTL